MTTNGRLSTCAVCGATIRYSVGCFSGGWSHAALPEEHESHRPEPDDGAVSPPDEDDEAERALDEDADAYHERMRD